MQLRDLFEAADMAGAYKVLGLLPDAGRDAAKEAFRRLASKFHPDKFTDPIEKKVAEAQFKRCKAALDFINTNGVNRGAKQSFSSAEEEYADAYAAWRKTNKQTPPPAPPNLDAQKQAKDKADTGEEAAYHNAYDEWYKKSNGGKTGTTPPPIPPGEQWHMQTAAANRAKAPGARPSAGARAPGRK